MACLQIYLELLLLATFLWVHLNLKEISYLSWHNAYPNFKTTCHIKQKFFLWTKLIENLLFVKYLISVAATLSQLFFHILYTQSPDVTDWNETLWWWLECFCKPVSLIHKQYISALQVSAQQNWIIIRTTAHCKE